MVVAAREVTSVICGCGNFLTMSLKFTTLASDASEKKNLKPFSFLWKNLMMNSVL
jgi:hypothetical protein